MLGAYAQTHVHLTLPSCAHLNLLCTGLVNGQFVHSIGCLYCHSCHASICLPCRTLWRHTCCGTLQHALKTSSKRQAWYRNCVVFWPGLMSKSRLFARRLQAGCCAQDLASNSVVIAFITTCRPSHSRDANCNHHACVCKHILLCFLCANQRITACSSTSRFACLVLDTSPALHIACRTYL